LNGGILLSQPAFDPIAAFRFMQTIPNPSTIMPRTLYSPRLSDDVVRLLYQEGKRRRMPMTRLADELLLRGLSAERAVTPDETSTEPERVIIRFPDAA